VIMDDFVEPTPDSGTPELPAAVPNLSDGSTKVLTSRNLKEMGLEAAGWKAAPGEQETFAEPEVPHSAVAGASAEASDLTGEFDQPAACSPAPDVGEQPPADLPQLKSGAELNQLSESVMAFSLPAPAPPPSRPSMPEPTPPLPMPVGLDSPTIEMPMLNITPKERIKAPSASAPAPLPARPAAEQPAAEKTKARPAKTPAVQNSETTESVPAPLSQNLAWILLISYASAVTLALLYLVLFGGPTWRPHQLESLPDVAPEPPNQLTFIPPHQSLPPGHVLRLGESRRFGNIEVEPVRVTWEPVEFTHYSGATRTQPPPTAPVLKLWLRFTNRSTDQQIAPLDAPLLFKFVANPQGGLEYSNQYLYPRRGKVQPEDRVAIFRHSIHADWDLAGQNLGRELAPGESVEIFIPSADDGTADLQAPVAWRVQLRKGFSPSGKGVTTLVEVQFDWEQIERQRA
jgi:hypothetical protein